MESASLFTIQIDRPEPLCSYSSQTIDDVCVNALMSVELIAATHTHIISTTHRLYDMQKAENIVPHFIQQVRLTCLALQGVQNY